MTVHLFKITTQRCLHLLNIAVHSSINIHLWKRADYLCKNKSLWCFDNWISFKLCRWIFLIYLLTVIAFLIWCLRYIAGATGKDFSFLHSSLCPIIQFSCEKLLLKKWENKFHFLPLIIISTHQCRCNFSGHLSKSQEKSWNVSVFLRSVKMKGETWVRNTAIALIYISKSKWNYSFRWKSLPIHICIEEYQDWKLLFCTL